MLRGRIPAACALRPAAYCLKIAERRKYAPQAQFQTLQDVCGETARLLNGFIRAKKEMMER